jgi:hypothetical protein
MTSFFSAYGQPPDCDGLVSIPNGGVAVPGACSGHEYVLVTSAPCMSLLDCATILDGGGPFDYALCADGSYSVCTATLPSDGGWVQVVLPDGAPMGDAGDGGDGG